RHYQALEGSAATGDICGIFWIAYVDAWRHRLLRIQAVVLARLHGWHRAHCDWNVFFGIAPASFYGHHRRIHREHPHASAQPSLGRRARTIEFPVRAWRTAP